MPVVWPPKTFHSRSVLVSTGSLPPAPTLSANACHARFLPCHSLNRRCFLSHFAIFLLIIALAASPPFTSAQSACPESWPWEPVDSSTVELLLSGIPGRSFVMTPDKPVDISIAYAGRVVDCCSVVCKTKTNLCNYGITNVLVSSLIGWAVLPQSTFQYDVSVDDEVFPFAFVYIGGLISGSVLSGKNKVFTGDSRKVRLNFRNLVPPVNGAPASTLTVTMYDGSCELETLSIPFPAIFRGSARDGSLSFQSDIASTETAITLRFTTSSFNTAVKSITISGLPGFRCSIQKLEDRFLANQQLGDGLLAKPPELANNIQPGVPTEQPEIPSVCTVTRPVVCKTITGVAATATYLSPHLSITFASAFSMADQNVECLVEGLVNPDEGNSESSKDVSISTYSSTGFGVDLARDILVPPIFGGQLSSCTVSPSDFRKGSTTAILVSFQPFSSSAFAKIRVENTFFQSQGFYSAKCGHWSDSGSKLAYDATASYSNTVLEITFVDPASVDSKVFDPSTVFNCNVLGLTLPLNAAAASNIVVLSTFTDNGIRHGIAKNIFFPAIVDGLATDGEVVLFPCIKSLPTTVTISFTASGSSGSGVKVITLMDFPFVDGAPSSAACKIGGRDYSGSASYDGQKIEIVLMATASEQTGKKLFTCWIVGLSTSASISSTSSRISIFTSDENRIGIDATPSVKFYPVIFSGAISAASVLLSQYKKATACIVTVAFIGSAASSSAVKTITVSGFSDFTVFANTATVCFIGGQFSAASASFYGSFLEISLSSPIATTSQQVSCTVQGLKTPNNSSASNPAIVINSFDFSGFGVDSGGATFSAIFDGDATTPSIKLSQYALSASISVNVRFFVGSVVSVSSFAKIIVISGLVGFSSSSLSASCRVGSSSISAVATYTSPDLTVTFTSSASVSQQIVICSVSGMVCPAFVSAATGVRVASFDSSSKGQVYADNVFMPEIMSARLVNSVFSASGASSGATGVIVSGSSSGRLDYSSIVLLGASACVSSVWRSDTSVFCRAPAGIGLIKPVTSSVLLQYSSMTNAFYYSQIPGPFVANNTAFPTSGGTWITMIASNYASFGDCSLNVRFFATTAQVSRWCSFSAVFSKTGRYSSKRLSLAVSMPFSSVVKRDLVSSYSSGDIRVEKFLSVSSAQLSILKASDKFKYNIPDSISYLPNMAYPSTFGISSNQDNYGARFSGMICPLLGGTYQLSLYADDQAELFLGRDDEPGLTSIGLHSSSASLPSRCQFTSSSSELPNCYTFGMIRSFTFVQGYAYRFEVLFKEYQNSDFVFLGWQKPGESNFVEIPSSAFCPLVELNRVLDTPQVSSTSSFIAACTGGNIIPIAGKHFGASICSRGRFGVSSFAASMWSSDSSIFSRLSSGIFSSFMPVVATTRDFLSSSTKLISYNLPYLLQATSELLGNISVFGSHFGTNLAVSFRSSNCSGATLQSHSETVVCTNNALTMFQQSGLTITEAVVRISFQNVLRLDDVAVALISPVGERFTLFESKCFGSTCGSTITSFSFLFPPSALHSTVVPDYLCPAEGTYLAADTAQIIKALSSMNAMGPWAIVVKAGSMQLEVDSVSVSFKTSSLQILIGSSSTTSLIWYSDSRLSVAAPGYQSNLIQSASGWGKNRDVRVMISTVLSPSYCNFSYPNPVISAASISIGSVKLLGASFANIDPCPRSRTASTSCSVTSWRSDTSIVCNLSPFVGRLSLFAVSLALSAVATKSVIPLNNNSSLWLSSELPIPATGASTIIAVGTSFGYWDSSVRFRMLATSASLTSWIRDTCIFAKGVSIRHPFTLVHVTVAQIRTTNTNNSNIASPFIILAPQSTRISAASTGGQTSLFSGGFFGQKADSSLRIRYADTSAQISFWISDSSALCKSSSGYKQAASSTLKISHGLLNDSTISVVYEQPLALSLNISNFTEPILVLFGSSFGLNDAQSFVEIDGLKSNLIWTSDSVIATSFRSTISRDATVFRMNILSNSSSLPISQFDITNPFFVPSGKPVSQALNSIIYTPIPLLMNQKIDAYSRLGSVHAGSIFVPSSVNVSIFRYSEIVDIDIVIYNNHSQVFLKNYLPVSIPITGTLSIIANTGISFGSALPICSGNTSVSSELPANSFATTIRVSVAVCPMIDISAAIIVFDFTARAETDQRVQFRATSSVISFSRASDFSLILESNEIEDIISAGNLLVPLELKLQHSYGSDYCSKVTILSQVNISCSTSASFSSQPAPIFPEGTCMDRTAVFILQQRTVSSCKIVIPAFSMSQIGLCQMLVTLPSMFTSLALTPFNVRPGAPADFILIGVMATQLRGSALLCSTNISGSCCLGIHIIDRCNNSYITSGFNASIEAYFANFTAYALLGPTMASSQLGSIFWCNTRVSRESSTPIRVLVSCQSFRKYFSEFLNISGVGPPTTLAVTSPPANNASVAGTSLQPITFKLQDFSGVASMQPNAVIRVRIVPKKQTRLVPLRLCATYHVQVFFAHSYL
jgi:hypothetical protein